MERGDGRFLHASLQLRVSSLAWLGSETRGAPTALHTGRAVRGWSLLDLDTCHGEGNRLGRMLAGTPYPLGKTASVVPNHQLHTGWLGLSGGSSHSSRSFPDTLHVRHLLLVLSDLPAPWPALHSAASETWAFPGFCSDPSYRRRSSWARRSLCLFDASRCLDVDTAQMSDLISSCPNEVNCILLTSRLQFKTATAELRSLPASEVPLSLEFN